MADGNITVEASTQAARAELDRLRAENAALKRDLQYARDGLTKGRTRMREDNERLAREAHTWWTAARDAAKAERARCALRVALHSQYPITTDFDRGYDKARKDAAETLRAMDDEDGMALGPNVLVTGNCRKEELMDPVKPAGNCPVDLSLGPLPEAAHSLRVGDAEYKDAWTAAQMHEERERCYALGVAAERERIRALVQAVRDANRDAEDGGTFRLLKPGQERAWVALLAGLDGPNVMVRRERRREAP